MASRKFVNSVVLHTPTGFFVANAGDNKPIPDDLVERATAAGAFGSEAAEKAVVDAGPKDFTGQFTAGAFTVAQAPGVGTYAISGPGLQQPENVKGKAAAQTRLDELNKALAEAGGGNSNDPPTD
jgi:hypothetical protein